MVAGYLGQLLAIANDPSRSWANRLAAMRMALRKATQQHEQQQRELWSRRRRLRQHLPFTRTFLRELEAAQHEQLATYQALLRSTGSLLVASEAQVLDALGRQRLLDLLGVNPVHRRRIPGTVERLLCAVVLQGLEDSARQFSGRRIPGPRSGPLARAFNEVMACATLQKLRNSRGKTCRTANAASQRHAECATPVLTVHNADGSRQVYPLR
ncbi:hypothetical protein [Pseudomonas tohonis]|uniref:hypothetical protein n=1 Tax=Pseudomonas tohonis TaxID=2725477 RepID=UPI0022F144C4|nr:hypothetical protein [Pseudomonas tohonis]